MSYIFWDIKVYLRFLNDTVCYNIIESIRLDIRYKKILIYSYQGTISLAEF